MTAPALILQGPDAREEFRRWSLAAAIVCAAERHRPGRDLTRRQRVGGGVGAVLLTS